MQPSGRLYTPFFARFRTLLIASLLSAIAIGIVGTATALLYRSHEQAGAEFERASRIKDAIEELQTLHVEANTDFLKGLGTAQWASSAWPIPRVGAATRLYNELSYAYLDHPADVAAVDALRHATAQWEWQLDLVANRAMQSGQRIAVDSATLLQANETLRKITNCLAALRIEQDAFIANNAEATAQRLATQRIVLIVAGAAAFLFLTYGFVANHRAALARARVRIVAEEAEMRFREYFVNHPLAMLIYDSHSLDVLTANHAAAKQYGYADGDLEALSLTDLVPSDRMVSFLADLEACRTVPNPSGSAGVRRQLRRDGSTLFVEVSYHYLRYAGRDACFIVAIDVTEHEQAKEALQQSKQMLETVINAVPHRIFWKDPESRYVGCNQAFADDAGMASVNAITGMTDDDMPWRADAEETRALDARVVREGGRIAPYEQRYRLSDRRWHWLRKTKIALRDAQDRVTGVLTCYEDVTERKDAELALRLRSRALDAIVNAVLITEAMPGGNQIRYANPAFQRITGYRFDEVTGRDCRFLQGDDHDQPGIDEVRDALHAQRDVTTLVRNYRKDGSLFWNQLYIAPVPDENGVVTHHISVVNDVTELVESRDMLHSQARFDALTALPNRTMLGERLAASITEAAQNGTDLAVLFMDLDHFKDVNDSLGHGAGDRLLREVAVRLANCIDDDDTIARYGGDEFVLLIARPHENGRLDRVLARIRATLDEPVQIDGIELHVETSIGIAYFPADGGDAETLLKNADFAMYRAKTNGRNSVDRFEPTLATAAEERIAMSRRMRRALKNGEFHLSYQPQVNLRTNIVTGVEALLRWYDPELGPISPASFIPVAEENGLIGQIGEWALNEACAQAVAWKDVLPGVTMSVNVSARQLARGDFEIVVARALGSTGLPAQLLELEITETALMAQGATDTLQSLRQIGVGIAIDDFGTGYSSLAYIRNFAADRLKIDISFVRGIGQSREDEAIIRAILALGRTLDFTVVAEGVETLEQLGFLAMHNCHTVQGYFFGRAMRPDEAASFIDDFNRQAAEIA
ncbi:EAL domain-containing protein [Paraburkholderia sp.]|uniref:sensor domain-containing protein n=1 Tax=Paraburkholderia sp. TaxID=1926495 RepID=UPI00238B3456|nr:EAL domain-containing protein [Paraburkholderia sp.]MDE1182507.1 EAL domain-containing protein [Paraburkholderia sp.]